ncbi:MAG TPA: hypothetical protein VM513_03510 [Kofleriaceae bacterium]|jgi:ElaB/YqjD/DUF883 family membrane-anchored ribosome-binding protein|nr:hypothetical protein [Kofleriaceae bacterium]
MRNERVITSEIEFRRAHLEQEIEQLKALIEEKVEKVRQIRSQVDHRAQQAAEKLDLTRSRIAHNPWPAVGSAFAAGALLALYRTR